MFFFYKSLWYTPHLTEALPREVGVLAQEKMGSGGGGAVLKIYSLNENFGTENKYK